MRRKTSNSFFKLIDQGQVDAGLVNRLYGVQFAWDYDIERSNILVRPSLLHFVVPKGRNSDLISALDRQLNRLKAQKGSAYFQAVDRWLPLLEERGLPTWLWWTVGILAGGVIVGWIFIWLFRRQVASKTAENENTLKALTKSETKYRRLVEGVKHNVIIYAHDTEGVFSYVSPSITDVLGYTQVEFFTHYTTYLTDSSINKKVEQRTSVAMKGEAQQPYDLEIKHKDGSAHRLMVSETPIFNSEGDVEAIKDIQIHHEFAPDLPKVECVRSNLQQVLLNVFANAAHAFQADEMRTELAQVTIRTYLNEGMVLIEVADNGPGMREEVRKRVFEPFFSTTPPRKGNWPWHVGYLLHCL